MIQTSNTYRPFPVVRDVDCFVAFKVTDQNAKKDGTEIAFAGGVDVGGVRRVVNDVERPGGRYASLERGLWALDGTFDILPDNDTSVEVGWWTSVVSGADGTFPAGEEPWIQFQFADVLSTLGWTLHFDDLAGQFCDRVRVTSFDADGVTVLDVAEFDSSNGAGGAVQSLQHYVGDYYGVRFDFLRTSEPYRRVRLIEVDFGLTKSYERNSLGSVRLTYGVDLLGEAIPSRELSFTFDNSDKQYNLLNPDGVYQYLQDGQMISVAMGIGGERVPMGDFYFTRADVTRSGIVPEILAHDRVYVLDNVTFEGGRAEDVTLSAAISEVLDGLGIPFRFDGDVGERVVSMTVSPDTKVRTAVQLLAQAGRCSAYVDRDGVMVFRDFISGGVPDVEDGAITADELYDYTGVSIADRVDGVRLTVQDEHRIGQDGTPGRQVSWFAGDTTTTNQAKFGNSCVADSEGPAVAAWLLRGAQMRKRYSVKNRCDPAVELGDVLRIDDIFGNRECAIVTGIEAEFNGVLSAQTSAVGA